MKLIYFLISLFCFSVSFAQNYTFSDFRQVPIPKVLSKEWFKLNNSGENEIAVKIKDGQLIIQQFLGKKKYSFKIKSGLLISINAGEWGGGLYYKPKDKNVKDVVINGKKAKIINDPWRGGLMIPPKNPINKLIDSTILLKNGNVDTLFTYKDSLFFVESLAHMSLRIGSLYSLSYKENAFTIRKVVDLPDAPSTIYSDKESLYIVTNEGFYIIDKDYNVKTILTKQFWESLYPNSIALKGKNIVFIGMRGGYAEIDLITKEVKFFQLKKL